MGQVACNRAKALVPVVIRQILKYPHRLLEVRVHAQGPDGVLPGSNRQSMSGIVCRQSPRVQPVGFEFDGTYINIGGFAPAKTRRRHNILFGNNKIALVVDDLVSTHPVEFHLAGGRVPVLSSAFREQVRDGDGKVPTDKRYAGIAEFVMNSYAR